MLVSLSLPTCFPYIPLSYSPRNNKAFCSPRLLPLPECSPAVQTVGISLSVPMFFMQRVVSMGQYNTSFR